MHFRSAALALTLLSLSGLALADGPEPLLKATKLPVKAAELREAGVPDAEVAGAVRAARDHGLKPDEAEEVLEAAERGTRANGQVDNLGGFVNQKLDEGLRGKELAAAIHAEHEARGKGKGGKGKSGKGKGHDKHDDKGGKGKGHDKHDDKGGKGKGHDKHDDKGGKGHDKHDDKGGKGHDKHDEKGGKGQGGGKGGNSKGGKGKGR